MKTIPALFFLILIFTASSLFAADTKMSKEDRKKMAKMHAEMAECMKSDKAMSDCQGDMMKSCKEMMGKSGCPMMDGEGMMMNHDEKSKKH